MKDIAVVVSVAGEEAYFEFASYSIPSFLRNNRSADLFVFTDNVNWINKLSGPLTGRLHVVDLNRAFKGQRDVVSRLKPFADAIYRDGDRRAERINEYGYFHHHLFVSALLPVAEHFLCDEEKYTHILKIDIDSYFAGGDMMLLVKENVRKGEDFDLFLVERKHRLMKLYAGGQPGVGFTLWRKGSNLIPAYLDQFCSTEQVTILHLWRKKKVKTEILERPGYHFVYPFWKNENITKDELVEFLPAYFHLHGIHARENMKKLEEWFNV